MKIGILQTGHAHPEIEARHGPVDTWFHALLDGHGFSFQTWPVVDGNLPDAATDADGWLITGSKHGAYDDLPWIAALEDFIRDVSRSGRPMVGICFGHQIIAQALGGRVEKFSGGWGIGQQAYDMNGINVTLNAWHQDQVIARPGKAKLVASSDFCENAILAYGERILTVQAHPEFSEEFTADMLAFRGAEIPAELRQRAASRNGQDNDNTQIAELLVATLKR